MQCEGSGGVPLRTKVLIVGYGNSLRSDDGFGWQAAERLADLIDDPDVDVRALHQLTPELAEPLSQAGYAIFLDAAREGTPGELRTQRLEPEPPGASTHHLTPAGLLALARELYGHAPAAVLLTAAGATFEFGATLSEVMEAALGEVCGRVLALLQEL
jgi:hydrogenase maturation protease